MWRQPKAVGGVAFAWVIAFMGIGLVDPIIKPIADNLDASPSQVSLLFTSYMAVMGVAMLITGVVASRIGPKRTLLLGLVIIIAGAGLAGMSGRGLEIVGWRALWGLGNALFIAAGLATIVSPARRAVAQAIIRDQAAPCLRIRGGRAAAAAPLRHRADADRQSLGDDGDVGGDGRSHRPQSGPGDVRRRLWSVHRHQQHVDHRDRDEGCARRTRRGFCGLQL